MLFDHCYLNEMSLFNIQHRTLCRKFLPIVQKCWAEMPSSGCLINNHGELMNMKVCTLLQSGLASGNR